MKINFMQQYYSKEKQTNFLYIKLNQTLIINKTHTDHKLNLTKDTLKSQYGFSILWHLCMQ